MTTKKKPQGVYVETIGSTVTVPTKEPVVKSRQVAEIFQTILSAEPPEITEQEHFWVACLSSRNIIQAVKLVSLGSVTQTLVHPREVFKWAFLTPKTAGVIVCHNHPAGNPEPSPADRDLTLRFLRVAQVLGVPLLDHVIIGDPVLGFYSFADQGDLR